jgi:hypothetical protein
MAALHSLVSEFGVRIQPKAIASGLVSDSDALDPAPGLAGFVTPTIQEPQRHRLVGIEPLERLALNAGNNSINEPLRLAHLNHGDDRAVLLEAGGDLLASKACDMGRSVGLLQSAKAALPLPPAP